MVKPVLQLYPVLPATRKEREQNRPLGRNAELYHQVLHEWTDVIKAADEMGYWGASTIEHHFHSEGYEVGPSPGMLNAYWAAHTENLRLGQLGYVMSAQNPIRVAEEIAILDHLAKGRIFIGFARGYQARWTNILGQHLGSRATLSPRGLPKEQFEDKLDAETQARWLADDDVNREIFEEEVDFVLRALEDDAIDADGRWQVPFPRAEGVPWTMTATREIGAHGEMDEEGKIRKVAVVPAPYYRERPPIFVSSNASRETVEYCARMGFIPTYFAKAARVVEYANAYVDAARAAGRDVVLGQNQAIVRWGQMADTPEAVHQAVVDYDVDIFADLYAGTTPMAFDPNDPVSSVLGSGIWMTGSPGQVKDQYVELWRQVPAEYVVTIWHFAQQPKDSVLEQMSLFMAHVKPALDELTAHFDDTREGVRT